MGASGYGPFQVNFVEFLAVKNEKRHAMPYSVQSISD